MYKHGLFRTAQVPDGGQATRLASFLTKYLDGHPGEDLSILAHSEGGVVGVYTAKEKLNSAYAARIKAIVTLDSPLGGINGAARGVVKLGSDCPFGDRRYDAASDMDPTSAVITGINVASQPTTKLYTVDAVPGYFAVTHIAAVDLEHSTTSWAASHIQVAATGHGDIWKGCFIQTSGCVDAGGINLGTQGRRLARFAACGAADLADDCAKYADQ